MQSHVLSVDDGAQETKWPIWLAPSLLLLDVMAQPMSAFTNDLDSDEEKEDSSGVGEFFQVRDEHKKQAAAMAKTANEVFSAVRALEVQAREKSRQDASVLESILGESDQVAAAHEVGSEKVAKTSSRASDGPFSSVPPYFPLLPLDAAEACVALGLDLLGKGSSGNRTMSCDTPPGIVQAVLFLFTRLLRSPKLASQSLRLGAAELILSLPRSCRFNGNAGVVTVIFRCLLEDDATLQVAMETEIHSTVMKLHGKQSRQGAKVERPRVSRHSFVQAVTPLICRVLPRF